MDQDEVETVRGSATLDLVQSQWLVQHGRRVDNCPSEGLGTGQDGQVPSLDVPDFAGQRGQEGKLLSLEVPEGVGQLQGSIHNARW